MQARCDSVTRPGHGAEPGVSVHGLTRGSPGAVVGQTLKLGRLPASSDVGSRLNPSKSDLWPGMQRLQPSYLQTQGECASFSFPPFARRNRPEGGGRTELSCVCYEGRRSPAFLYSRVAGRAATAAPSTETSTANPAQTAGGSPRMQRCRQPRGRAGCFAQPL